MDSGNRQMSAGGDSEAALACLRGGGDLRVWSLIVSIFGDLAQPPDAAVSGALLTALSARMGLRPEAMRVALHRLRRDGWIVSRRRGRGSRHRLSASARRQTEAARPRIYGPGMARCDGWQLVLTDTRPSPALPAGAFEIAPGTLLCPPDVAPPPDSLCLGTRLPPLPGWLRARLAPAGMAARYRELAARLADAVALLEPGAPPAPLDAAALRVLAVHRWRRLLLRHAELPPDFLPEDWPGTACRRNLQALLARLPRPPLDTLEAAAAETG